MEVTFEVVIRNNEENKSQLSMKIEKAATDSERRRLVP